MRRLLPLVVFLLSSPAWAVFTAIGCTADSGSTGIASLACQEASNSNNNDIQLVFVSYPNTSTATVSDTFTLTYTRWQRFAASNLGYNLDIYCAPIGSHGGAKDTVTISFSPNATFSILAVEERTDITYASGCTKALDTGGSGAGIMGGATGNSATPASLSATSARANDTALGFGVATGSPPPPQLVSTGGYTDLGNGVNANWLVQWKAVVSAGTSASTSMSTNNSSTQQWGTTGVLICPGDCASLVNGFIAVY